MYVFTECSVTDSELEKCRDDLKHCYCKRNQQKSTIWPNKLGDCKFYIDVIVARANILPGRLYDQHAMSFVDDRDFSYSVTTNELLEDGYGKVILIEGDPGAGKTTFAFQICKDWAENKFLMEDVVFWIPLRHYKSVTTINKLFSALGYPEMIYYAQQNSGKGLVLILDGWDELPKHQQTESSLFHDIAFGTIRTFTHSTIIVMSRPTCSVEIAKIVEETNSYYRILGFNFDKVVDYMCKYFKGNSIYDLPLHFLASSEYFSKDFCLPISVAIMCFVYQSDGKQTPHTLSKLYERFIVLCLRSYVPKVCQGDLAEFKTIHTIPEKMRPLFHKLCKIAFHMLKDNDAVLNEAKFEILQDDLDSLQLNQFDGFGLLCIEHYTGTLATVESSYSFIHQAVQELLAAVFILNTESINDVLDKYFYEGSHLLNMFPFLFGLLPKECLAPLAAKLIQIFNNSDKKITFLSSILYCLFEAHDETLCREFGQVYNEERDIKLWSSTLLDCQCACYFIASCGVKRLNVTMYCSCLSSPDPYFETVAKHLPSTSVDIAGFRIVKFGDVLSHEGMKSFVKTLLPQQDILTVELIGFACEPGCVTILCDSISKHNFQITSLVLPHGKFSQKDLDSIGFLLTTCSSLESLHMGIITHCEGMCLDVSAPLYKAMRETKSLKKLYLWKLSQSESKVLGIILSQNFSLKELYIQVATADCLDPILSGLLSNTSITTFRAWPHKNETSITLEKCLENFFSLNHSLNVMDVMINKLEVSWSPIQVSSICAGLCTNTTCMVVTLDISGSYIDTAACDAVCGMLSLNTVLQHLFLNPVHLEKQEAIGIIDGCKANATLKVLSLVQFPAKTAYEDQGKKSFWYSDDQAIQYILEEISKLRQEKDEPILNVCWLVSIHMHFNMLIITI